MGSVAEAVPPFAGGLTFEVLGLPVPQGSKQAFVVGKRAVVTERAQATLKPWRSAIAAAAAELVEEPLAGPLSIRLAFTLPRPKSHYRTGARAGELRETAPRWVETRPDVDKLTRAVLDALTGVAYRDDGQIAWVEASKMFGARPGVAVAIVHLEAHP